MGFISVADPQSQEIQGSGWGGEQGLWPRHKTLVHLLKVHR